MLYLLLAAWARVNLWDRRFVEYQALVKDKKGVERGYSLIVDLSKMSEGTQQ